MWFSASILLKRENNNDLQNPIFWEENLLLLQATSAKEAEKRSEILGREMSHSYRSGSGEMVEWKYDSVLAVYQLWDETIKDETIVFARHLRDAEVASLKTKFHDSE